MDPKVDGSRAGLGDGDAEVGHLPGGEADGRRAVLVLVVPFALSVMVPVLVLGAVMVIVAVLFIVGVVVLRVVIVTMPLIPIVGMLRLDDLSLHTMVVVIASFVASVTGFLVMVVAAGGDFASMGTVGGLRGISLAAGTHRSENHRSGDESQRAPAAHGLSSCAPTFGSGFTLASSPGSGAPVRRSSSAAALW
jgi:hypothetical protein